MNESMIKCHRMSDQTLFSYELMRLYRAGCISYFEDKMDKMSHKFPHWTFSQFCERMIKTIIKHLTE